MLQDVLQAAPSLREKRTVRTVFSFEEGVDQVLLFDLVGDRFGSQVAGPALSGSQLLKHASGFSLHSIREKRRRAVGRNHASRTCSQDLGAL